MKIDNLHLEHFKNYAKVDVEFSPWINLLTGLNGVGKTNMLDSIHYLTFTKSAFTIPDTNNIRNEESYLLARGTFHAQKNRFEVTCFLNFKFKKL